jgi:hypothetical protein
MRLGPRPHPRRGEHPQPQQQLAQPLARAVQVLARISPRAGQVPQRLMWFIGDPHRGQLAAPQQPRQLLRVPAIRLHPVAGPGGHQRRRYHDAARAQPRELPLQSVPARPGLVAALELRGRTQLADQARDRFRLIGDRPQRAGLPAPGVGDGHRDRGLVHVQPYKLGILLHDRLLLACSSALRLPPERNLRCRELGSRSFHSVYSGSPGGALLAAP